MPVYSHSRLSTFEKCPLQYQYRYVDRIRRDTQSIEAFMGNRVHEVLESLYRDLLEPRIPTLDELLALYQRNWEAEYSEKITIAKTDLGAGHYRAIGAECIAKYYARHHPFDDGQTLGLEEKISLALDDRGRYQIQGYIDRLVRRDAGVYEIHDFKTSGGRLPSDADLRKDRQLTLYQMAVERRFPDARDIRLVWHYLAADQRLTSRRTPEEVVQHRRQAIGLIETIERTREFPPRASVLCRWCEYQDICEAGKEFLRAGAAPARRPSRPLDQAEQMGLFK